MQDDLLFAPDHAHKGAENTSTSQQKAKVFRATQNEFLSPYNAQKFHLNNHHYVKYFALRPGAG